MGMKSAVPLLYRVQREKRKIDLCTGYTIINYLYPVHREKRKKVLFKAWALKEH